MSRTRGRNVIMISELEYNSLLKDRNNLQYLKKLNKSIQQMEDGNTITKTMEELLAMER